MFRIVFAIILLLPALANANIYEGCWKAKGQSSKSQYIKIKYIDPMSFIYKVMVFVDHKHLASIRSTIGMKAIRNGDRVVAMKCLIKGESAVGDSHDDYGFKIALGLTAGHPMSCRTGRFQMNQSEHLSFILKIWHEGEVYRSVSSAQPVKFPCPQKETK